MSEKKVTGSFTAQSSYGHTGSRPYRRYVEIAVLGVAIALIWSVLTLPTVFYHLPMKEDLTNSSSIGPTTLSDECASEVYTGSVCRSALQSLQNCIPDHCGSADIYILSNTSQSEIESHVMRLLGGLELLNPSSECLEAVGPFLCSYYFGLCSSDNQPHLPSSSHCEKIAMETCATEFERAISLLGRESLPQCETLSEVPTFELDCTGLGECRGVPGSETVTPETTDPTTSSPTDSVVTETTGSSNEECNAEIYAGGICRAALQSLQNCIPDRCNSTEIYIPYTGNQSDIERQLTRLLVGLQLLNLSEECQASVVPFLCSYYFRLCDSNGKLYLPSYLECETVATETCGAEFQRAVAVVGSENLPQCDTLPQMSTIGLNCSEKCEAQGTTVTATQMVNNNDFMVSISSARNISCREGFYLQQRNGSVGACIPECGKWEEFPHHIVVAGDIIVIVQAVVYIIAAAVLLAMACVHHKRMFKFPAIFVIYEMFPLGLFEVFILIAFMDRTALYCSSKSLPESLNSPTVFCNIQGGVSHFIFMQQILLWLFHIVAVFWTIKFPFHAKYFENKGYTRFVHFGMLALSFILPTITIAVVFGTGGCRTARIPAIICLARKTDATFYAFVLPLSIVTAAGISLIVYMFWILYHITRDLSRIQRKKQEEEKGEKEITKRRFTSLKHHTTLNAAEMKILIIFIYFSVFLGSTLITFTIRLHGFENLIMGIGRYFTCESFGIQDEDCMRSFERVESEASAIITYALIGFYPLVSLIYVVNIQELRQKYPWLFKPSGRKEMTSTSGTFRSRGTVASTGV